MKRILDATVTLLRESGPDKVGVREIAQLAGHNQRFVVEWFGSKVELFRVAFLQLVDGFVRDGLILERRVGLQPEIVLIVRLMNWLVANGSTVFQEDDERPLVDLLQSVYRDRFGLDDRLATLFAQRLVGTLVTAILFGDLLRLRPEDVDAQIALDVRLAELVAEHGHGPLE
jgi:AcrR family transcriptional regulator